jgi:hypothetical protein
MSRVSRAPSSVGLSPAPPQPGSQIAPEPTALAPNATVDKKSLRSIRPGYRNLRTVARTASGGGPALSIGNTVHTHHGGPAQDDTLRS